MASLRIRGRRLKLFWKSHGHGKRPKSESPARVATDPPVCSETLVQSVIQVSQHNDVNKQLSAESQGAVLQVANEQISITPSESHIDILKARIDKLTKELATKDHSHKQLNDFSENQRDAYLSVIDKYTSLLDKQLRLVKQNMHYTSLLCGLDNLACTLRADLDSKVHELNTKDQKIAQFTRDIFRLNDARPESTRDDYYFQTKFASLFRSIHNWVYVHYLKVNVEQTVIASLGGTIIGEFLEKAGDRWEEILQNEHITMLHAIVISRLVAQVLALPLLGVDDACIAIFKPAIVASLEINSEQDIKWRTTTISTINESSLFWEAFETKARALATEIVENFAPFAPKAKKIPRKKKLTDLIIDAGKLSMECALEPSKFLFLSFPPGTECSGAVAKMASEAKGSMSDQELASSEGNVIAVTAFPAVIRVSYQTQQEILVLKAGVLVSRYSGLKRMVPG